MIAAIFDDNYERIKADLSGRGLTHEGLMDDVLDHVCCMVEESMDEGSDFETSYNLVLDTIGYKSLPEIQHQTLLNLDKKFQRMKNFTYIFGLTSALLTIIGAFFKKMHWPGAGILITVGIVLVALVFLPLYFYASQKEQVEKKNPVYAIVGYLTIALLLAGALFKIMHWPGAGKMLYLGTGFLIVGFIPLYVVNVFQKSGSKKITLPYVVMLLVGISIVMLHTNVNIGKELIEIYLQESELYEEKLVHAEEGTASLLLWAKDSCDSDCLTTIMKIHEDARDLQEKISSMQEGMIGFLGQPGASLMEVKGKDNRNAGRDVIVDSGKGQEFARAALAYRLMLEELIENQVSLAQITDHLECTGKVWPTEYGVRDVVSDTFIKNYYKLSDAALGIALAEYVAISSLLHQ